MQLKSLGYFIFTLLLVCQTACQKDESNIVINADELPLSTTLEIVSLQPSAHIGDLVTFEAKVTPRKEIPTQPMSGTISFFEEDKILCAKVSISQSNTALCTVSFSDTTMHTISAVYNGDEYYATSKQISIVQNIVGKTPVIVTVKRTSTNENPYLDEKVIFTAAVISNKELKNSLMGSVSFFENGVVICDSVPLSNDSNSAICAKKFHTSGSHTLFAVYNGDDYYAKAQSENYIQKILDKILPSILLQAPYFNAVVGQVITLTAKIETSIGFEGQSIGALTFKLGDLDIENCSNIPAQLGKQVFCEFTIKNIGNYIFSAVHNGYLNYAASISNLVQLVVDRTPIAIDLAFGEELSSPNRSATLHAKIYPVTSNPTGDVTFYLNETAIPNCIKIPVTGNYFANCEVEKSSLNGKNVFRAEYSGDANNMATRREIVRYITVPTKANLSLNSKSLLANQPFTLNASIEVVNDPTNKNITGHAQFFNGSHSIAGCEHVAVHNGQAQCLNVKVQEAGEYTFSVKYIDTSFDGKYSAAMASTGAISIDTQVPNSPIYIVTGSGQIAISTNGGRSWVKTVRIPGSDQNNVLSLSVTPIGDIYVGATDGHVYYSRNNGNSWDVLLDIGESESPVNALSISGNYDLFVGLQNGRIKRLSLNTPQPKWVLVSAEKNCAVNALAVFNPKHAFTDTNIFAAYSDHTLAWMSIESSKNMHIKFQESITSLQLGADDFGRILYLGSSSGDVYYFDSIDAKPPINIEFKTLTKFKNQQVGAINGIFMTPSRGHLNVSTNQYPNFSTLYLLAGSKIGISIDNGITWDVRDVPDGIAARGIFVSPILYAVSGKRLSDERDIKLSKDNGKNWFSIKDNLGESSEFVTLNSFFVTPQNGILFTLYENKDLSSNSLQIRTSINGGLNWKNNQHLTTKYLLPGTALFANFVSPSNNLNISNVQIAIGHENGLMTIFNSHENESSSRTYKVCHAKNSEYLASRALCRVNAIQPSQFQDVLTLGIYPNIRYSSNLSGENLDPNGVQYLDINNGSYLPIAANNLPVHSFAINQPQNIWYKAVHLNVNIYNLATNNALLKSIDDGNNWETLSLPQSGIPVSLYALGNGTLYMSIVESLNRDDYKFSRIYTTTDDGKTWRSVTQQPHKETRSTNIVFAQYQYN